MMKEVLSRVDLSELPPPDVVEVLRHEQILQQMLDDLRQRDPDFESLLLSDPACRILEVCAYREVIIRQRVNEAARANMVAHAAGADLDNLAANYGIRRLLIAHGNPDAVPPVPDKLESDDALRARIVLSLEAYTTAGSRGSYVFHALSASGEVKDVGVASLEPGTVNVAVLSRGGNGEASPELLQAVVRALNAEDVRPLCDTVSVRSAEIVGYTISATLQIEAGAGRTEVMDAVTSAARAFVDEAHQLGRDVNRSAIVAALHQPGVLKVTLASPDRDIDIAWNQAAHCSGIELRMGEDDV